LLGSCSGNYAHWLTEILPKLLYVDEFDEYSDFPLLVDAWIHRNFVDSINFFGRYDRRLLKVPRWKSIELSSLIDITPPAYVPPEYRILFEQGELPAPRHEDFPFNQSAIAKLRITAESKVKHLEESYPRKLYLTRARESCGNTRQVVNIEQAELIIDRYGFEPIDPAKFSFAEQVALFSKSEKIVSPLGASLANTIFTPPGCRIIGLSPYYEKANYYYFSNFMGALGHNFTYVLGPQCSSAGHILHRDYEINLEALEEALDSMERGEI